MSPLTRSLSGDCMKQMTIVGWVCHGIGSLTIITALATDHWLHRLADGQHTGIFPCCPSFKCDHSTRVYNRVHIDVFIDLILVGLILVILGGFMSVSHACYTWRYERRTFVGMVYMAAVQVTVGGIIFLSGAIEFAVFLPQDLEYVLKVDCSAHDHVEIAFSFHLFIAGATTFIISGILLLLGRPAHCKRASQNNTTIVATHSCDNISLQTDTNSASQIHYTESVLSSPTALSFGGYTNQLYSPYSNDLLTQNTPSWHATRLAGGPRCLMRVPVHGQAFPLKPPPYEEVVRGQSQPTPSSAAQNSH